MLTRPAGFGRAKTAFVFDNGTTVLDAPDGGEIRIKSYDEDDALLAHQRQAKSPIISPGRPAHIKQGATWRTVVRRLKKCFVGIDESEI
ncbi:hypothetical protein [Stenotrophomonas sp. PS02298]|uniref:hypothetical protein n=1 Tax=Stenotrophomonas sp. PS02298 TaxID=2991424 RepID=UPI00249A6C29|nr:hypothetical protein [Stenotrophomonas sp. PS02298]